MNIAIGATGVAPLEDYRGYHDPAGYELGVTVLAVAHELAGAAELVMNKLDARPVVLIRGYKSPTGSPPRIRARSRARSNARSSDNERSSKHAWIHGMVRAISSD